MSERLSPPAHRPDDDIWSGFPGREKRERVSGYNAEKVEGEEAQSIAGPPRDALPWSRITSTESMARVGWFFQAPRLVGSRMCEEGRSFSCGRCGDTVHICRCCDRGNQYCRACAPIVRRESVRKAGHRYQRTFRGARKHADRQRRLRERRRQQQRVTHRGSTPASSSATLDPALAAVPVITQEAIDAEDETAERGDAGTVRPAAGFFRGPGGDEVADGAGAIEPIVAGRDAGASRSPAVVRCAFCGRLLHSVADRGGGGQRPERSRAVGRVGARGPSG